MNKKGYFLLYYKSSSEDHSGVGLKIRNQIKAFNDAGLHCEEIVLPLEESKWNSLVYRLPFSNVFPRWVYKEEFDSADFLYFRRPYVMTTAMRRVLKKARKRNPKIKIVIEIPTYPYDPEYRFDKLWGLLQAKDRYNRKRMKGIVDYYAMLDDMDTVFGLPVLRFVNGIDVESISKRVPVETNGNEIHLCAVAMFKEWHGYERIIEGMKVYYHNGGKRNLIIHFVGDGNETKLYKEQIKLCALDDHFIFHGFLEGEALDEVYNISTLALGSFGMYKIGIHESSNLKSRESVARGIPSVTGCPTDIFPSGYPYCLEFPNDPSPVDMQKVIDFHDRIYSEGQTPVIETIREYAYKTVSIQTAMKNVIDFLRS